MHTPPDPKYPAPHSHASPALFSSELAGHMQSDEEVDPVLAVAAPTGHELQLRASPGLSLYVAAPHGLHAPPAL